MQVSIRIFLKGVTFIKAILDVYVDQAICALLVSTSATSQLKQQSLV